MKMYDLAWRLVPPSQEDLSRPIKKTLVMWEPIQVHITGPLFGMWGTVPTFQTGVLYRFPHHKSFLNASGKVPLGCGIINMYVYMYIATYIMYLNTNMHKFAVSGQTNTGHSMLPS